MDGSWGAVASWRKVSQLSRTEDPRSMFQSMISRSLGESSELEEDDEEEKEEWGCEESSCWSV